MRMWRPKDPRAITIIRLTCWAGVLTWVVFTLAFGIVLSRVAVLEIPKYIGITMWGQVWTWVVPIWVVFTTLMLIWAMVRFVNKRLSR